MTVKVYFWQCGIISGATGLGEDKMQVSEMGSFILQVEKLSFQLGSPCWWLPEVLYEYPGVEVKLFVSLQVNSNG